MSTFSDFDFTIAPAVIDLSHRAKWALSGKDRVRYLNGQVTNDVTKLTGMEAIDACVTNSKGKMEGELVIASLHQSEVILLDAPPELAESLGTRLDRYLISDDAELTEVTDEWGLFHLLGGWRDRWVDEFAHVIQDGAAIFHHPRLGIVGADLWVPKEKVADARELLRPLGLDRLDGAAQEWLRVSNGIPVWGRELTPDSLPPEARLEGRSIAYDKGCYIGQEVISRIRSVGKVNRLLVQVTGNEGVPNEDDEIWTIAGEVEAKKVGRMTSVAVRPAVADEWLGLGYVKRDYAETGTVLRTHPSEDPEKGSCLRVVVCHFP